MPSSTTGAFGFTVIDPSGNPIQGATVASGSLYAVTDSYGFAVLDGLPAGTVSVTFSASGYVSQTATLTVIVGTTQSLEIPLTPKPSPPLPARVVFNVLDHANPLQVIAGATVTVNGTGGFTMTAVTDATGVAGFDLTPASYTVTITAANYAQLQEPFLVPASLAGLEDDFTVSLTPATSPPPPGGGGTPPPSPTPSAPGGSLVLVGVVAAGLVGAMALSRRGG